MIKQIVNMFPLSNIKNVRLFYILTSVYNMWFVGGIWVFIWGKFLTKTEIGISDLITFTLGFLVELPSGVFADIIGRKKAIFFGNVMLLLGNLGLALSSSFIGFTGWYLLWTIGYAFQSGATEALAYDSVKKAKVENDWSKVIGTSVVIGRITAMLAYPIGGFLFAAWFRLPYLAFAATGIIGVIAAYKLIEIPVKQTANAWSLNTYLSQIKDGLSVLAKPNILPTSLVYFIAAGLAYLYNWGLLRPLTGERFGYNPVTLPLLLIVVSFGVIVSTSIFLRIKERLNISNWIYYTSLLYFLLFIFMSNNFGILIGGLIMIFLTVLSTLTDQLFSQFINSHTHSKHRATTLSAVALITKLPYVVLAIPMGILAENNKLALFCFTAGLIGMATWIISYFRNVLLNTKAQGK